MMKTGLGVAAVVVLFTSAPLSAQGPPPAAGPFVVRGEFDGASGLPGREEGWWMGWVDAKRGLVAIHGVDIVSWCQAMPTDYSVWYFQNNVPPADEGLLHMLLKADDVVTSVWPTSIFGQGGICNGILNMGVPLAEGTVDMLITDNDYWAWLYDHDRANAVANAAHGLVYTPEGERLIFHGSYQCVYNAGHQVGDPGVYCKASIIVR